MTQWQPIESAEDQAGPILLFDGASEDGTMWVATRMRYPYATSGMDGWSCPHGWCAFDVPSHWMPLPPPPASETLRHD